MRGSKTKFKSTVHDFIKNEIGAYIPSAPGAYLNDRSATLPPSLGHIDDRDQGSHTPSRYAMLAESDVTVSVHSILPNSI